MITFRARDRRFHLDPRKGLLLQGDRRVDLAKQQYNLLRYLLETRPGELIAREELLGSVWKGKNVNEEALTRAIFRLRRVLGDDETLEGGFIETVRGRGVRFVGVIESTSPSHFRPTFVETLPPDREIVEGDKIVDRVTEEPEARQGPEFRYDNLFRIASKRIPFVPLFSSFHHDFHEFQQGDIDVHTAGPQYSLPSDFADNVVPHYGDFSEPKCRFEGYEFRFGGKKRPRLGLTFSQITYGDYLKSGEHLDNPLSQGSGVTFRDRYAPAVDLGRNASHSRLANICGVGIFVVTRDHKLLISRHSRDVIVLKGVLSYTASGTMDWSSRPDPFDEVARECFEEVGHPVIPDDVRLFSLGIDAKRLYYQFSFYEQTARSAQDIVDAASNARDFSMEMDSIISVPFELDRVLPLLMTESWEPAAAAGLLTLCAKEFGLEAVERAVDSDFVDRRWRDEIIAEWNARASRPGDLAVMSARYPSAELITESQRYVTSVLAFIGDDIEGRDVVEVGCGTGRLTKHIVTRCDKLTCVDISEKMLFRNREQLGTHAGLVSYQTGFCQDYRPLRQHDVAIASLVLIHNITAKAFHELAQAISACANVVFLFEHVGRLERSTATTRTKSEAEILAAFNGFVAERREDYVLFEDQLTFLKLVRSAQ